MDVSGLQKLTLLDYPGRVACTVFTGGCNLRCPFCHNASLALPERERDVIGHEELMAFLKSASVSWTAWPSPAESRCCTQGLRVFSRR